MGMIAWCMIGQGSFMELSLELLSCQESAFKVTNVVLTQREEECLGRRSGGRPGGLQWIDAESEPKGTTAIRTRR